MRDTYRRLLADPDALEARLADGALHARRRADAVVSRAMTAMGL